MSKETHIANESGSNGDRRSRVGDLGSGVTNLLSYVLISRFQYAHVRDKNTGALTLREGPDRLQLASNEELDGEIREKVRVGDRQFAIILNPFNPATKDIREGERETRIGPVTFALHPGEELEDGKVRDEFVLESDQGLLLRAEKDAPHPLAGTGNISADAILRAGAELLLVGSRRYIPHSNIRIVEERSAVALSRTQGIYVQNDDTGDVRLIRGPKDVLPAHNESFWEKELTTEELQALGYDAQPSVDGKSRVLAAAPRPRTEPCDAVVIDLEDNEAICIYDGDQVRVTFGPNTVFLEPHARPKVLFLSGSVPVRPNVLRTAKLKLGPDFIRDQVTVRTKDNATLVLEVNYRWRFRVDEEHPEQLFALKDFVGFAAQALGSEIRGEAAKHDFEDFHARAAEFVTTAIFKGSAERVFSENGLAIFGIDVEGITPEDTEIKRKLADAIKTNVDIYTKRVQEVASLESERRVIEGKEKNEQARRALIDSQGTNERARLVAEAEAKAEAGRVRAQGEAEAITIRAAAERTAEEARLQALAKILETPGGQAYIELERARVLKATDKIIVPTGSKLVLGIDGPTAKHAVTEDIPKH
ncbi:hypothetical protein HY632_05225 [Candidatus Uhrbacteria bacterium]|nr:hypothetical protein [Candidatus Uhrbacteria bacterium]